VPRGGDQAKKGKRKGRNKQETPAYTEPSARVEEVKTPLDLAKVSVPGTRGLAACHSVLRARFEPGLQGKVMSNTDNRCDWKAEISFQNYKSFVVRVCYQTAILVHQLYSKRTMDLGRPCSYPVCVYRSLSLLWGK